MPNIAKDTKHRPICASGWRRIAISLGVFVSFAVTAQASELTLEGKKIGVAVVGTQHFWDREAFNGALDTVRELGGEPVPVDGGRDNQVHADNHDILLTNKVDAVISILGDGAVEPKFEALGAAGIPVFTVDHLSPHGVNNTTSDNYYMGTTIGRYMADAMGGKGKVAVFNAFEGALRICGIRTVCGNMCCRITLRSRSSNLSWLRSLPTHPKMHARRRSIC